ncbi:hypothetical protein EGR_01910 [Echinococcus granulosus]|uniref:Uncharacterized protein n=1 Tax=Echinococcus granulosus TaxID=6210 RepID=W6UQY7_ECHGR|nr:hypothetical protein EGR_01910 [Echinococcus granulosus]EUB63106.1 hypothetical protein EGR_01910 [Echinococcus granulosus]
MLVKSGRPSRCLACMSKCLSVVGLPVLKAVLVRPHVVALIKHPRSGVPQHVLPTDQELLLCCVLCRARDRHCRADVRPCLKPRRQLTKVRANLYITVSTAVSVPQIRVDATVLRFWFDVFVHEELFSTPDATLEHCHCGSPLQWTVFGLEWSTTCAPLITEIIATLVCLHGGVNFEAPV